MEASLYYFWGSLLPLDTMKQCCVSVSLLPYRPMYMYMCELHFALHPELPDEIC